ncbi:MAG: hypothetical protein CMH36_01385 [Microbacterium sp.]|uniref:hypothetical protein n=1 Tax=uncultured Microbacterium sp. TaxID=191216 RepID=UPI000C8D6999|nr:hypothetical protein [Microbacterium sp.]
MRLRSFVIIGIATVAVVAGATVGVTASGILATPAPAPAGTPVPTATSQPLYTPPPTVQQAAASGDYAAAIAGLKADLTGAAPSSDKAVNITSLIRVYEWEQAQAAADAQHPTSLASTGP